MSSFLVRNFTVRGLISCTFQPETTPSTVAVQGILVQLWQKSPMDVILLGKGLTDATGQFIITLSTTSPAAVIQNGSINEVFIVAYYNGQLITGANPY